MLDISQALTLHFQSCFKLSSVWNGRNCASYARRRVRRSRHVPVAPPVDIIRPYNGNKYVFEAGKAQASGSIGVSND